MRSSAVFWYYFLLIIFVALSLVWGDFTYTTWSHRVLIGVSFLILFFNPFLFLWRRAADQAPAPRSLVPVKTKTRLSDKPEEFISLTTHQLRTPLSAVKWTLHMMLNGDLGPLSDEQKRFLQRSYQSLERSLIIVNDLLNLEYLDGDAGYQFRPTDLAELVESVAFEFSGRLQDKNLQFEFQRPKSNMPPVELDPVKISMALENLLDNAIKYTPPGGQVTVAIDDNQMTSALPQVDILVSDSGVGISPADAPRIFDKFFRSAAAKELAPAGTGLGLFVTRAIARRHGGEISFAPRPGGGTVFRLSIPLSAKKVV